LYGEASFFLPFSLPDGGQVGSSFGHSKEEQKLMLSVSPWLNF
jgi:hypothetical protein